MKVSVIIPVYNVEKYIKKTLDSVINQTYRNIEIIIIDDGSTDNTFKICEKYQLNKNVKIIKQINKGVSNARNNGLKIATGEYILFVDGDDYIEKNTLKYNPTKKQFPKDNKIWHYFEDIKIYTTETYKNIINHYIKLQETSKPLDIIINKILDNPNEFYTKITDELSLSEIYKLKTLITDKSCKNCTNITCQKKSQNSSITDYCKDWSNKEIIGKIKLLTK